MRKILLLGCAVVGGFALLGWLVDPRMFVMSAYTALIYVPILLVGALFDRFNRKGNTWPSDSKDHDSWPPDLNPDRKPGRDPMW